MSFEKRKKLRSTFDTREIRRMKERAERVAFPFELTEDNTEFEYENYLALLTKRESLCQKYDMLEEEWRQLGAIKHFEFDTRDDEHLQKEKQNFVQLKRYWRRYEQLAQSYRKYGVASRRLQFPVSKQELEEYEREHTFTIKWLKEIADHRRQLLFWYRRKIHFPTAPFTQSQITTYVQQIRPLLEHSRIIKNIFYFLFILGIIAGVVVYVTF